MRFFWRVNEFVPVKLCAYDLKGSLDMANNRRSLKLTATPLSSSCSYNFLSYWMQSRTCCKSCSSSLYQMFLLLFYVKNSQDVVHQLLTCVVCRGRKQLCPLSLSFIQIQYYFFRQEMKYSLSASCFFNISRNKWVWFIGLRIKIDSKWNICHMKNEIMLWVGEGVVANQPSGD